MFDRREKTILALMSAVHFCLIVDFMVVMPQGPQLMRTLGISAQRFGLLVSAYTLGAGVLSLVASAFVDRFERKRLLLLLFAGFGLCNLACAFSGSYASLALARFVTGAFGGVVGSMIFSIVSDSIDLRRRSTAVGIVMSAFALASILGVPICLLLSGRFGWSASFYFLALTVGLVAVAVWRWLPRVPVQAEARGGGAVAQLRILVAHPSRSLALVFMSLLILGHFTIIPFLFPSVVSNAGIREAQLPVIYLVGGTASIVASVLFGKAADKFGRSPVFAAALLGSLIPIFWVTHLRPVGLISVVAIVSSFFVLMSGRLTPATALVTATAMPSHRGGFMSLVGSVQQLSAALAAFLSGMLVAKAPDGRILNFAHVGFLAIAFSVAALLLSLRISPVEESAEAVGA